MTTTKWMTLLGRVTRRVLPGVVLCAGVVMAAGRVPAEAEGNRWVLNENKSLVLKSSQGVELKSYPMSFNVEGDLKMWRAAGVSEKGDYAYLYEVWMTVEEEKRMPPDAELGFSTRSVIHCFDVNGSKTWEMFGGFQMTSPPKISISDDGTTVAFARYHPDDACIKSKECQEQVMVVGRDGGVKYTSEPVEDVYDVQLSGTGRYGLIRCEAYVFFDATKKMFIKKSNEEMEVLRSGGYSYVYATDDGSVFADKRLREHDENGNQKIISKFLFKVE